MKSIGKRMRYMVRFFHCMLRKPLADRRKLMLDLQLFHERHKIAGKTPNDVLMTSSGISGSKDRNTSFDNRCDVQFSCTISTKYQPTVNKWKNRQSRDHHEPCSCDMAAISEVFDMLKAMRVTDFPVQMVKEESDIADGQIHIEEIVEEEGDQPDGQIDMDAENFIREFYNKLRLQEQLATTPDRQNELQAEKSVFLQGCKAI